MSDDIVCASVRIPDELNQEIEDQLDYGDTKDEWIREAIEQRLKRELATGAGP
jgi:predicted DNA-binding protein